MAGTVLDRDVSEQAAAVARDVQTARRNVIALGDAVRAAGLQAVSPELARAVQAQENLFDRVEREFELLTSVQVADRVGSRAAARRNAATVLRREGKLLGLRRGRYVAYPGFQFGPSGVLSVVADLRRIADQHGWDEISLLEWLMGPTGYLDGARPVDMLADPDRVLDAARAAFGVSW